MVELKLVRVWKQNLRFDVGQKNYLTVKLFVCCFFFDKKENSHFSASLEIRGGYEDESSTCKDIVKNNKDINNKNIDTDQKYH